MLKLNGKATVLLVTGMHTMFLHSPFADVHVCACGKTTIQTTGSGDKQTIANQQKWNCSRMLTNWWDRQGLTALLESDMTVYQPSIHNSDRRSKKVSGYTETQTINIRIIAAVKKAEKSHAAASFKLDILQL